MEQKKKGSFLPWIRSGKKEKEKKKIIIKRQKLSALIDLNKKIVKKNHLYRKKDFLMLNKKTIENLGNIQKEKKPRIIELKSVNKKEINKPIKTFKYKGSQLFKENKKKRNLDEKLKEPKNQSIKKNFHKPIIHQEKKFNKENFFNRIKYVFLKQKENIGYEFTRFFREKKVDNDLFEKLEEKLLIADIGINTTRKIIDNLMKHASLKQLKNADSLLLLLKEEMNQILKKIDKPPIFNHQKPSVFLIVGVNGVGKTTTIGKLAYQFKKEGKSVMLAAGDTFRAAAIEQLQILGKYNNIPVIAQKHVGADSASVIYDTIQSAKSRNIDVLLADTAGRFQNKLSLMRELKKIIHVIKKLDENAPHEVILIIDANTGQNAINQAKLFHEAVGLTGIILTKLDGTAKSGIIFSIADQLGIPIHYISTGEHIEDLHPFNAKNFIEMLFIKKAKKF